MFGVKKRERAKGSRSGQAVEECAQGEPVNEPLVNSSQTSTYIGCP